GGTTCGSLAGPLAVVPVGVPVGVTAGRVSDIVPAACLGERDEALARILRLELGDGLVGLRLEVVADRNRIALAPFGEIIVGAARVGAHRGHVDGLLEAHRQFALGVLPALADDDLTRNVAPVED